jgi:hypothetical protein
MAQAKNLPSSEAKFAMVSSVEGLSGLTIDNNLPVVLNECNLACPIAFQYLSTDMLKILLAVGEGGDIRARDRNIRCEPGCPRIFTCNAVSGQAWLGTRAELTFPVRRKMILFQLTTAICVSQWSVDPRFASVADIGEEAPLDKMQELVAAQPNLLPASAFAHIPGRWSDSPEISLLNRVAGSMVVGAALCSALAEGVVAQL